MGIYSIKNKKARSAQNQPRFTSQGWSQDRPIGFSRQVAYDSTGLRSLAEEEREYKKVYKNERDLDTWKPSHVATVPFRELNLPHPPRPMNI